MWMCSFEKNVEASDVAGGGGGGRGAWCDVVRSLGCKQEHRVPGWWLNSASTRNLEIAALSSSLRGIYGPRAETWHQMEVKLHGHGLLGRVYHGPARVLPRCTAQG